MRTGWVAPPRSFDPASPDDPRLRERNDRASMAFEKLSLADEQIGQVGTLATASNDMEAAKVARAASVALQTVAYWLDPR